MKITRFADIPQLTSSGKYAVDIPLDHVAKQIRSYAQDDGLILTPDFQRRHVWTKGQQVAYMEYLLRGGRSGRELYFNCPSWHLPVPAGDYDEFVCVDGLQRITSILHFLDGKVSVFGSKYQEFTDHLRMSTQTVRIHINDLKTRAEVLQWYLEMNSGGTPHTKEEIARVQALFDEEKRKEILSHD